MLWNGISGISDPIPIRQFNGLFVPDDDGYELNESLFVELENFSPSHFPALSVRDGYSVIGEFGGKVLGFGAWKNQELHAVFGDGTWRKWNGEEWVQLAFGLDTSANWTFTNFKGNLSDINLIGCNGVDPVKRYDGSAIHNLANAPEGAKYITTHSNRVYCAVDNYIRFSALNKPEDWTTANDAGEIQVNTTDGETISGLGAGIGHLTVFKPSSLFELYGKGPQSYSLEQIATDLGAINNKSIVSYDESVIFLSRYGLYSYGGGIRPRKEWSLPVQNLFKNLTPSDLHCAGYDGKYLYINLADRLIQFNPISNSWYSWENLNITHLTHVNGVLYAGDSTGRVLRMGGDTDNGAQINARAITKPFTSDSMARRQQWFKLWLVASLSEGSTIKVSVKKNDWIEVKTIQATKPMEYQELLIPLNTVADAHSVQIKIETVGKVTINEITRQLRHMPMRR